MYRMIVGDCTDTETPRNHMEERSKTAKANDLCPSNLSSHCQRSTEYLYPHYRGAGYGIRLYEGIGKGKHGWLDANCVHSETWRKTIT